MTGARLLALAALLAPSDPPPLHPLPVSASKEAAVQPSVAVDGKGGVHVAFASGERILLASCPPGKREFATRPGPPARDFACGMRRGPRLAACGDALVLSWIEARFDAKRKVMIGSRDLLASRSLDGGATWSAPAPVNRRKAACGEGLHAMAEGPGKDLYAAWLQAAVEGKPGTVIRLARSEDAGATWAGETTVYESPSGTVCECCHPSLAVAPDGTVAVLFRNSLDGARDLFVAVSADRGKTFAPAKKQGTGTWPLKGCPMDGGGVAFGPGNAVVTAWRRERTVFLAGGADAEESAGPGEQPWAGGIPGGASFAAWTDADGGLTITDLGVPSRAIRRLPPGGERLSYPVVAGSASGVVFAAWERVPKDPAGTRIEGAFLLTTIEGQLDRVPPKLRDLAIPGLRSEGPASRIWEDLLASRNGEYAALAAWTLAGAPGNRGWEEPPPPALREAVLAAASRPEPDVRAGAVEALGHLWPEDGTLGPRYLEALRDGAVPVRQAALEALRTLGPASRGLDLGPVRSLLGHGDELSYRAARTLAACGDASPGTIETLVSAAEDSERRGQAVEAMRALGSLGPRAASATPRLGRALEGASGVVARDLADAIGLLGGVDAATFATLARLVNGDDLRVRVSAALALVRLGKAGTAEEEALSGGLHGSDSYTSVHAAEGLLLRGLAEEEGWLALEKALAGDGSPVSTEGVAVALAVESIFAAGKTPPPSLTAALERASRARSPELRRASRATLLVIRGGK